MINKRIILLVIGFFSIIKIYSQCTGNILTIENPSLEGTPAPHVTPPTWDICMPGTTPDTQPGSWGVDLAPSNGSSYVGFVHQLSGSWQEGAGQTLSGNMVAGLPYSFTIDLACAYNSWGDACLTQGCIQLQIYGGTAGVNGGCDMGQLLWSSGNVTNTTWQTYTVTFTPTSNWDHILLVSQNLGCTDCACILVDNISPIAPVPVTLTTSATQVSCYGSCNGTATVAITSGTPVFDIYWTNASLGYSNTTMNTPTSGNTIVNLCPGTYNVSVVDNNGCTSTATATVNQPAQMTINLTSVAATCGLSDGSITAIVTNGVSVFDYQISPPGTSVWNQAPSSHTFTNLAVGSYGVTVTDNNGCTASGTISVSASGGTVTAGFTYNGNQCDKPDPPGNTVSFTNTSTGATSYAWDLDGNGTTDNTSTNPTYTYTNPGIYNVKLTATVAGCSDVEVIPVTIYNLPVLTFSETDINCNGSCNGSIQAVPAAGGPYGSSVFTNYSWSNSGNTQTISNLCPGTFTVTVTDNLGCTGTGSATITQPPAISVSVASTNATCNGVCNGTAQVVSATGGIGPFGEQWSTGATTQSISGLCPGTYYVTTTDNGAGAPACTNVQSVSVSQPPAITLTTSSTNSSCGGSTGTATVTPSGGTAPYTYFWTTGSTNNPITNIPSGSYPVTVTDALGCTAATSVNVSDNSGPSSSVTSSQNLNCNGVCIGSFTVQVSGGTSPYTYNWDNSTSINTTSGTTQAYSNLCAGIHTVDISDNNGCSTSESVTLTQPAQLTVTVTGTSANCNTPGSAIAFPNGGVPNYTYSWDGGATSNTANGLTAGIYCVTVTDANLCTAMACVTITDIGGITATITGTTGVSCYGGSNGTATVQVTGGTANYTYQWSNSYSTSSASSANTAIGLAAGTITVTITDINGCGATASGVVATPSQVTAIVSGSTNPTCNGSCNGTATVTATGGTPGYTYQWSFGTGGQTTNPATNLCAGTYSVTISDVNGCTGTASVTLTQPSVITASATATTAYCNQSDGTATATNVTGGNPGSYSYQWSAGSPSNQQTAQNLPPGPVTVTVYDALGCSTTANVTVPNAPGGIATIVNVNHVTCNGFADGSATVSYSGTIQSVLWNNNAGNTQTVSNLSGNIYTVTVTDNNNCTATASVTINEPALLTVSLIPTEPDCYGGFGNITTNTSGGTPQYSYQWSNGSTVPNPSVLAGSYCVTVFDDNGCSVLSCETVTQSTPITLVETIVDASCGQSDGSISVVVAGGAVPYTYLWNTSATTSSIVDIPAGTYVITVKDAKFCSVVEAYIVNNISGPTVHIDSVHHILCYGDATGSIFASTTGGSGFLTYSWSDPNGQAAPIATNLTAGTYYITVTDQNNCSDVDFAIVQQPAQTLGFFLTSEPPLCFNGTDGSALVNVYGGTSPYIYLWSGGGNASGNQYLDLGAGNYSIQITDANDCSVIQSFSLSQPTQIILGLDNIDASCSGIANGMAFVDILYGGTPIPVLGYNYVWIDNQMTDTAYFLTAGNYCLTVYDDNNCSQTACINVGSPSSLQFQNINIVDVDCYNNATGSISAIVTGGTPGISGYSYQWEYNSTNYGTTQSISNLTQGVYYLTVTDYYNCMINTSVIVNQPPPLLISIPDSSVQCYGMCNGILNAEIVGGQSPYYIIWSTLQTDTLVPGAPGQPVSSILSNLCEGQYSVTIIDDAGCSLSDNATISEPPLLQVADVIVTDATCGMSDGCAQIIFNGGTVGFIFVWSITSGDSPYECGLAAGIYSVTIIDNNGCTTTTSINVNNLNGPDIVNVAVNDAGCNGYSDGSASVSYLDSNPPAGPYTITWFNEFSIQIDTGNTINNIDAGTYSVQVMDTNNCIAVETFEIGEPALLQSLVTNTQDATCFGLCNGLASVSVIGGTMPYSYLWSSGATLIQATGLCAGYVDVSVTDINGCTTQAAAVIGQPQQLNMTATVQNITCHDFCNGIININPTGGSNAYMYLWCNGGVSNVAGQLCAGTCLVVLYDQLNPQCNIDSSFTVTQPEPIVPYIITAPTTCDEPNGTVTITDIDGGSGMFDCVWSPPNTCPVATGFYFNQSYLLTIVDQLDDDCYVSQYVQVGRIMPPVVTSVFTDSPTCYNYSDGGALVKVNGGTPPYYYQWAFITSNDTNIISAGIYDTIAENLMSGYYHVSITDADNCEIFTAFAISQPNPLSVFGHGSGYICKGQTTVVSATASGGTPGYIYYWSDTTMNNSQSQLVSPANSTMYMVTAVDVNGCQSLTPAVVSISVRPQLQAVIFAVDTSVCEGEPVNMIANILNAYGDVYYLWSNGGTDSTITVSPFESTAYYLTVYDQCGIPAIDDKIVTIHPSPLIDVIGDRLEGCQPLLVNFTNDIAQMNVSYYWVFGDAASGSSNESNLQSPSHTYEQAGTYNVTLLVTDNIYHCTREFMYENLVEVYANPDADFISSPDHITSLFNAEVQFINQTTGGELWSWDFGDATYSYDQHPVHIYERADTFLVRLEASTSYGCTDTAILQFIVRPEFTFYTPTAFTPKPGNTQGQNDYFTPEGNGIADCDGCYHLYIYDRWGELIFETDEFYGNTLDEKDRWNGRVLNKGKIVKVGVYKWLVKVVDISGLEHEYSGNVTVIR
ncbi:MAG: PKD domain-containing protein [Bacteroidia bacterium]|nr:PKD domain-containing protein [Bacteroidia bacterium]